MNYILSNTKNRGNFFHRIVKYFDRNWSLRKYWGKWIKSSVLRFYYRTFHGINVTMLPSLGKGKFVDVIKRGNFLDIVSHADYPSSKRGTIRLIPCQFNHGVMVEFINESNIVEWRTHCDYNRFYEMGFSFKENNGKNE